MRVKYTNKNKNKFFSKEKNTMKMTRKFIPALVMLLVSAIMLTTASFAWLASSTEVIAGPMTVQANTDVVYLEISNDKNAAQWGNTAAAGTNASGKLELVTATVADKVISWKTSVGTDPTAFTSNGTYTPVNPITDEYALINTFYVRMSEKSTTDLENLHISDVSITGEPIATKTFDESLRVLVVATDEESTVIGYQCWDLGTNALSTAGGFTASDVLAEDVTKDTITLSVYIYFDGEDTYAFTNNLFSTLSREITVSFAATEPTV